MKHITIRLDEELHEFIRRLSFETRTSMNQIIVKLIKKLKQQKETL
ncbi:MAG: hypothetical protein A4E56_02240 [Pelotomaculum sp. PtaU1.Bin065]|nr:MAG: hypothetical protein A4E56_02240 [Pelotomaculum sp. PtaU1.Bin065]